MRKTEFFHVKHKAQSNLKHVLTKEGNEFGTLGIQLTQKLKIFTVPCAEKFLLFG